LHVNAQKQKETLQLNVTVLSIQADNQLLQAEKWQLLLCDPAVLRDEPPPSPPIPALIFEMSFTPTPSFDAFDV
jgi:hypothetical protein